MTAYRDENEALRARLRNLEDELTIARSDVARLKGTVSRGARGRPDSLVGEVVHHVDEIALDGVVDADGLAAIARVLRARTGLDVAVGTGSVTGRTAGTKGVGSMAFALENGATSSKVRLETDLRALPIAVALGPVLGGLSSLPFVLWQMELLHHFEPGESLGTTVSLAAVLSIVGAIAARVLTRRQAERMRERHDGVWATVLELARERLEGPVRVRVAEAADSAQTSEPEPEARAESTTPRARSTA